MPNPPHEERNVKITTRNQVYLDWQNSESLITQIGKTGPYLIN